MNPNEKKITYPVVDLQAIAIIIAGATTTNDIILVASRENITLNLEMGAKWRMLTDVFMKCPETAFFRMLSEFLHYLDEEKKTALEDILTRHGIHTEYTGNTYDFFNESDVIVTDDEIKSHEANKKALEQVKENDSVAEKIKIVREHHQTYIDVIEQFCKNYKNPSRELNEGFIYLKKLLDDELKELGISPYHPFRDLYSAEDEYTPKPMQIYLGDEPRGIDWNYFRPKLYSVHSKIVQLLSGAKTTTKTEAKIQEINSLVSKFRNGSVKKEKIEKPVKDVIHKIQIIKGNIEIDGLKEGMKSIAENKKQDKYKFPYKLVAGTQWEDFFITFEDDENVSIQVKRIKHTASYKDMGFIGRGANPASSEAWAFLKVLAQVGGELTIKDPEAKEKYRKQKEILTKALKGYFPLEYDPFFPYDQFIPKIKQKNSYKIKITLIPLPAPNIETEIKNSDDLGLKEYLDEEAPQVATEQ